MANKDLLEQALKSLGLAYSIKNENIAIYTPAGTISIENGKATLPDNAQEWLNRIKRAYSMKNIELVAKKYKFSITTKADGKLILRRY